MVRDYWMMSVCFIMMQASTPEFRKWVCYKKPATLYATCHIFIATINVPGQI